MKEFKKLIDVKSLITLAFSATLIYIVVAKADIPDLFQIAMTSVLTYYFTRKVSEGNE